MIEQPRCFERRCVHFLGVEKDDEEDESTERVVCVAYPKGIPDEVAYGHDLHLTIRQDQTTNETYREAPPETEE